MRKTKKEMLMEAVREPKKSMDSILLFLVLLLVVWGLIFLYSTSAYNGRVKFHDPAYYFKKQLFATSLGLIAMYLVSCIDYHIAVKFAPLFYLASMGLSLAVLLFGQEYNGSKRWLSIGPFSFQPSEFAKAAVILFLTFLITNSQKKKDGIFWMAGIMLPLLPIVGLVGTNNLSTAIIILGIGVILVFISHPRYLPFIGIGVAGTLFFSGRRVIVWSVLKSGEIRKLMKKDFKPFRDSMQSEVEGFLEVDLGAVFRNLDLFQKRKTT